jgi:hypothetical protein
MAKGSIAMMPNGKKRKGETHHYYTHWLIFVSRPIQAIFRHGRWQRGIIWYLTMTGPCTASPIQGSASSSAYEKDVSSVCPWSTTRRKRFVTCPRITGRPRRRPTSDRRSLAMSTSRCLAHAR